ncbi:MAG: ABC transporter permease [Dehalococcoidales bacterium]|nr:ABC transporter permease [Dehalococcoidales bacterium]
MDLIWNGIVGSLSLLFHLEPRVVEIILRSLEFSGTATLLSLLIGVPFGTYLAMGRFPGRRFIISLVNTGMGMPPVVVGLLVSIMLWRSGPFGRLGLIYTPTAVIIAQVVIATPLVTGISLAAMGQLDPKLKLQLLGLGASRLQLLWMLMREARLPLLAAVMAGFGGIISEVGAVSMVGGSIKGQTEVMTTAIVLEVAKGNFDIALALGIILLLLAYAVNLVLTIAQQQGRPN